MSFQRYWNEYCQDNHPSQSTKIKLMLSEWNYDSFRIVNESIESKQLLSHIEYLFIEYTWELFDKVFDTLLDVELDDINTHQLLMFLSKLASEYGVISLTVFISKYLSVVFSVIILE